MLVRVLAAVAAALLVAGSGLLVAQLPTEEAATPPTPATVPASPAPPSPPPAPSPDAPSPSPTAAEPQPTPSPAATATGPEEQRIAARLERLLRRRGVPGRAGIAVLDADGAEVFSHAADASLLPASAQKLSVAAAALARFGPDHRFTTVARAARAPVDGVLRGDLVVVGGADPTLASRAFARVEPERPRTGVAALARAVRAAGVRRIRGRVAGDPTIFPHEPTAAGWPPRYLDNLDATRITGLTVDAGRRLRGSGSGLSAVASPDPVLDTARAVRAALRRAGVRVDGRAVALRQPAAASVELTSVHSPPLRDILRYMVQRSDNHLADTVFRAVGAAGGDATWVGSAGATAGILAPLELDWTSVVLADGSGLSRANRVSARFLAQLQSRMWRSNLRDDWYPLMAVSGRHGTLRHRLRGTVAEGRLYGKTGSLRDVVSLVGTVVGTRGRLVHFAVVGNRLPSTSALRELTDRAVLVVAQELQDCRRVRPPRRGPNRRRPPPRMVCG